jgi:AcrR family transcriptional regulator
MPRLWNRTIETHRRDVREAILDTAAALVAEHGPRTVTMSMIAEGAGIGRATLYKYFPDIGAILHAWHRRQIGAHIEHLAAISEGTGGAVERLEAVLEAYAMLSFGARRDIDRELHAFLHRDDPVRKAQSQVAEIVAGLVRQGVAAGLLRDDIAAAELAAYCINAMAAAATASSRHAVRRLIAVTMSGLRPQR